MSDNSIIPIGEIGTDVTRDRVDSNNTPAQDDRPKRRPPWIKVRAPSGETFEMVRGLMRTKELHTVCEEAHCPNIGECWGVVLPHS